MLNKYANWLFLVFQVKPEEVQFIIKGYASSSPLFEKGVHLSGEKYMCIKADDRSIYGKKVRFNLV